MKSFALMCTVIALTGLGFGVVDSGIQSLILTIWGDKNSRSLIQLFHAAFSVGAFLAPIFCQPFMVESLAETLPSSCTNGTGEGEEIEEGEGENRIWIPYMVCGMLIVCSGLFYAFLTWKEPLPFLKRSSGKIKSSGFSNCCGTCR